MTIRRPLAAGRDARNWELLCERYCVTHGNAESSGILTIDSPLHPLRGSFPRWGTPDHRAAFGRRAGHSELGTYMSPHFRLVPVEQPLSLLRRQLPRLGELVPDIIFSFIVICAVYL